MATFFLHPPNWVKYLKILVTLNPRRQFLLIIRGIFLILLSSRSDKGHERQPNPLITVMNCEAVPLFDLSDMYSRVSSAHITPQKTSPTYQMTLMSYDDVSTNWLELLLSTIFKEWTRPGRERSSALSWLEISLKSQIIFQQSLFSTAIQTRGLVNIFSFWTELRNQLQSKCLRCCTYDSNLRPRLPTVVCALAPEPLLYVGLKTKIK